MNSLPTVNNLKTHICVEGKNIQRLITALQKIEHIVHNNFIVCRDVYTFIIFPKRGFINITGIKSFCDLKNVIPHFCKLFKVEVDPKTELVVDNISASGSFDQFVNLVKLQQVLNSRKKEFTVHFDRNFFPGAFCKTSGLGTLTLFPTGKYVVVGAKCLEHVNSISQMMGAVIQTL